MRTEFTLSPEDVEKFWQRVDRSAGDDACWPWLASMTRRGYGMFHLGKGNYARVNRVAWFLENGRIPDGMVIAHECDNPSCANPRHLNAISQLANIEDRNKKGRAMNGPNAPRRSLQPLKGHRRGEGANRAKLTAAQVIEIRAQHASGVSIRGIGRTFGVSGASIAAIVKRRSWQHVE